MDELDKEIRWFDTLQELKGSISEDEKGVLLMAAAAETEEVYDICRQFYLSYPFISIILFSPHNHIDIRKAFRSGVYDVITFPISKQQLLDTLQEAEENAQNETGTKVPRKKARVITVCSTKGGVGKTTFSVNLACAIAKQLKKVIVIDLDLQFGDVAMFFDQKPKKTIYEWTKEEAGGTFEKLKSYIHPFNDYIDIFAAPIRPEFSEAITEEHINRLIAKVKPFYDVVLIDTAPFMEGNILTALEESDDIFVVTIFDLPTLKNTKIFLDTLNSLSLDNKVKIAVNRVSKRNGIKQKAAESLLGLPIFLKIPDAEKVVVSSVNEGNPYVYSSPRSKVAKLIFSLAGQLFSETKPAAKKKLFFSRKDVQAGRVM